MFSQGPASGPVPSDLNADLVRRYDGAERVSLLPLARFVTVAPSTDPEEPVDVTIEWNPGWIEKPLPGSALWRAVLEGRLAQPGPPSPVEPVIRRQIAQSLERFPDLESWWAWVRTGWVAPPKPSPSAPRRPGLRALLRRFRRR